MPTSRSGEAGTLPGRSPAEAICEHVTGRNLSTKQLQEYDSKDVNISARGISVTSPVFCIMKVLMFVHLQISQILKHEQEENTVWIGVPLILVRWYVSIKV